MGVAGALLLVERFVLDATSLVADVKESPHGVKITWARLRDSATTDFAKLVN